MSRFQEDLAEEVHKLDKRGAGSVFWLRTTVVSAGLSTGNHILTVPASGGHLVLEDVILRTDGTGLAANATGASFKVMVI